MFVETLAVDYRGRRGMARTDIKVTRTFYFVVAARSSLRVRALLARLAARG